MITPVITEGAKSVLGYFPASHWYDYHTGELIVQESDGGKFVTLAAELDQIPVHIRGGAIIATQEPGLTTTESRNNPFGLIVAPDEFSDAHGDLFYDDGESDPSLNEYYQASFILRDNILRMGVERNDYANMSNKVLNTIRILVRTPPNVEINFVFNQREVLSKSKIRYEPHQIVLFNLNWPMNESLEIEWEVEPFFPPGSLGPIIDCSLDKPDITQVDCMARGCRYIVNSQQYVPNCIIPENKGGYTLAVQNGNDFTLTRADNTFALFPDVVNNLAVSVSHGSALSSREFRMSRITVPSLLFLNITIFICLLMIYI